MIEYHLLQARLQDAYRPSETTRSCHHDTKHCGGVNGFPQKYDPEYGTAHGKAS